MIVTAVQVTSTQSSMIAGHRYHVLLITSGSLLISCYMRDQVLLAYCLGIFYMHDQV